jgi:GGDEF domain-containing protein
VLLRERTDQHGIQHVADRIIAAISEPFPLDEGQVRVSVSMSIGIAPAHATATADDLLRSADLAMYSAKRAGKGQWVLMAGHEAAEPSAPGSHPTASRP